MARVMTKTERMSYMAGIETGAKVATKLLYAELLRRRATDDEVEAMSVTVTAVALSVMEAQAENE
jgi:hypothetical protein